MTTDTLPTVAALADPRAAIDFALDHLQPFEVADFMRERRDGKDLKPWLDALEADRKAT